MDASWCRQKIVDGERTFLKDWKNNTPQGAKAIIFLDMVQMVYHKLQEINSGGVIMFCDNKDVERISSRSIIRVNHFNQDAVAEGAAINRLIN